MNKYLFFTGMEVGAVFQDTGLVLKSFQVNIPYSKKFIGWLSCLAKGLLA